MHRRDFLLFRQPSSPRVIDVNCERLHMSYLDLQPRPEAVQETQELSFAEPPAILPRRDEDDWFASLEAELQDADVVRIVGAEWLRPDSLRERVDALLQRLMHRGVRVERPGD